MSASAGRARSGGWSWIVLGALGLLAVVVVVLSLRPDPVPFDPGSAEPDGYGAIRALLEGRGVEVRVSQPAPGGDPTGAGLPGDVPVGPGTALVVPVGAWLTEEGRTELQAAAAAGTTVVVAAPDRFSPLDRSTLTRTPAEPAGRGTCDMADLADLRELDDLEGATLAPPPGAEVCFAGPWGARVTREPVGDGSVVVLSSPYLWANARLQPDKERGGTALDNGPLAVALLGDLDTVTFVEVDPPPAAVAEGTRDPLSFLPLPVELALAQAVGAFVLYAWWRARRLGRPVREPLPVEVSGSELVEAVGGLMRRSGSPARAADVVRGEARGELASALGAAADDRSRPLSAAVARRCGRDPDEVHGILYTRPVTTAGDLVALAHELDELRTEVLDVRSTT